MTAITDGLLGAVASGAMESGALVAPLPGGRGNDFARAVGITDGILTVAKGLPTATERRVDIGEVAGTRFLGVAAVGYDSVANRIANESRLRGPLVYTVGGVKAVFRTRPRRFVLTVDGEVDAAALANARRAAETLLSNPVIEDVVSVREATAAELEADTAQEATA